MDRNLVIATALVFGLAAAVGSMLASEAGRRRDAGRLREEVNRWEDEGGLIPGATVAAETTTELP